MLISCPGFFISVQVIIERVIEVCNGSFHFHCHFKDRNKSDSNLGKWRRLKDLCSEVKRLGVKNFIFVVNGTPERHS